MAIYHTLIFIVSCTAFSAVNAQLNIPFFGGPNNVTDTATNLFSVMNNLVSTFMNLIRPQNQQQQSAQQQQQQQQTVSIHFV